MFSQLNEFFGKRDFLTAYVYDSATPKSPMCYVKTNKSCIARNNNDYNKKDVYFCLNGGPRQSDVKRIYGCFIDLDAGRTPNGTYFADKALRNKKTELRNRISKMKLKPTVVVETRNGYQVYWLFNKPISMKNLNEWNKIQAKLCNKFGGDKHVLKVNHLLRIPGSSWWKLCENTSDQGFICNVDRTLSSKRRYSFTNVKNSVKGVSDTVTWKKADPAYFPRQQVYNHKTPIYTSKPVHTTNFNKNQVVSLLYQLINEIKKA